MAKIFPHRRYGASKQATVVFEPDPEVLRRLQKQQEERAFYQQVECEERAKAAQLLKQRALAAPPPPRWPVVSVEIIDPNKLDNVLKSAKMLNRFPVRAVTTNQLVEGCGLSRRQAGAIITYFLRSEFTKLLGCAACRSMVEFKCTCTLAILTDPSLKHRRMKPICDTCWDTYTQEELKNKIIESYLQIFKYHKDGETDDYYPGR